MTGMLGGQSDLATWIIAISILISTVLSILAFLGVAQGIQLRVWRNQIESRLRILENYVGDVKDESRRLLKRLGVKDADRTIERIMDYFVVEPVSIEPTDITRRLERVIRTEEERIEQIVQLAAGNNIVDNVVFKNTVTLLGIANALNLLYKYLRHMLLLGVKTKNAMLVAQLWMMLPFYMRIAKAYRDAAKTIAKGMPIGDAAGPLVAYKFVHEYAGRQALYEEVAKDTVYTIVEYEGRKVYVVRAKGPGSTVGRPGEAVEKLADRLGADQLAAIITVDAALKFEGEETGIIAEGSGVAMGDPGPEKIRIERLAVKRGIPLHAIAIKMGFEEAIGAMDKRIVEGVEKALKELKTLILETAKPGDVVIVVGVGNSIGVGL
jgi:hypothetical protein